jgi:hypothetical protein
MKLDKFKLVREHPHGYEIEHPSGKKLHVFKSGLSKEAHGLIQKLADGGTVDSSSTADSSSSVDPSNPDYQHFLNVEKEVGGSGTPESRATQDTQDAASLKSQDANALSQPDLANLDQLNDKFYTGDTTLADQQGADRAPASWAGDAGNYIGNTFSQGVSDAKNAFKSVFSPVGDAAKGFVQGLSGTPAQAAQAPGSAPAQTQAPAPTNPVIGTRAPQSASPSLASIPGASVGAINAGFGQQAQGIQQEAAAQGALGKQQGNAADQVMAQVQQLHQETAQKQMEVQKNIDSTVSDIQNGHIDPNHYWESKSTGGKIATAIGLLLGGLGGPNNAAIGFMNNQIQNDIESQKANLGTKKSLLDAYYKQYGNVADAERASQATYLTMYGAQLQKAAAQSADPMAKARAQQMLGQLQIQKAQVLAPIAQRQALFDMQKRGQANPAMAIQILAPEGQREPLMKDLQTKQNMDRANQDLMNTFDYIAKNNTVLNKLNPQEQSRMEGMLNSKLLGLAHASAGRFNMEEVPYVKSAFPNATDDAKSIAQKRQSFQQMLQEKAAFPSLEPYGVSSAASSQSQFTPRMQ